jgi:N-acetylglutamate synthase-like GNAT family acetyltransferase
LGNFAVRMATHKDLPAIRALILEVHINPIALDWRRFLVVESPEKELLGCGQIKPHFDGSRELASIAVKERARGQGVARAVIQCLLTRESKRPIFLMCRARLEAFYVKFGFIAIGVMEMPPYFQRISRVERIFNSKARREDRLAVMRLS